MDAEGVEPLEIVSGDVCHVEPVVCGNGDVFTRSVAFDCHVAGAAGHDTIMGSIGYGKMLNEPDFFAHKVSCPAPPDGGSLFQFSLTTFDYLKVSIFFRYTFIGV